MSDLRSRLRNLRAITNRPYPRSGRGEPPGFSPTPPDLSSPFSSPQPLDVLVPGDVYETPLGAGYVVRTPHPPDHVHGENELGGWLTQSLAAAASFTQDRRLATIDPRRCLFLDTETTGLNAGAGTLVFLVGVGYFTAEGFEVRQYFLRHPGEEPAMLHAVQSQLAEYDALVTFNGRSFDVPLLSARYALNRTRLNFDRWPNLDLLHPARRLWRRRLESCRLVALEDSVLGVQRAGYDVPGWLIPQLYQEFVQTGDARQMQRVMYHNLMDVLSMVTLATILCDVFTQANPTKLPFDDLVSLARWYEGLDMLDRAEAMYRAALKAARHDYDRKLIVENLALLLKRQDRRADAEPYWQALVGLSPANPMPCLELAKYYEWTTDDAAQAVVWAQAARDVVGKWPPSPARQEQLDDIQHRLDRLMRKLTA